MPLSFITTRSASATVVDVAEVSPSIILSSVVVTEAPSSISSSASLIPALPIVTVPAKVTLAPLNVMAVVVPDLIIRLPLVLVALPNVVPPSLKNISPPSASRTMSVPASTVATAEEDIVRSVPSPSIFSPSSPNVTPMLAGTFISPPEPTVILKSVPSDSIFSAVANVSPTPLGILTSAVAVRLMLLPLIVRSVPSPSIFSPSSPKVSPIFVGILISPLLPTVIERSVPSDSIFSVVANVRPTPIGILISVAAVRLILLPEIVRSVPSPSIFSPASPKVIPLFADTLMSPESIVAIVAPPATIVIVSLSV